MKQFLAKRTRRTKEVRSIQVFEGDEDIEMGVAADLARLEGLEIEVFVGVDLIDVVRSNKGYFEEAGR